jgi:replication initiation and membrane attachment protein DnaB
MASIILNKLFYPDIVNIILDYVMVGKDIVRQIKNVNMDYLEKLAAHIMLSKNEILTSSILLKRVKFYREVNKSFLKRMDMT